MDRDNNGLHENRQGFQGLTDYGPEPFMVNLNAAARMNPNYRTTLWTGAFLQLTLMSIPPGGDIGLEIHPDTDQYIRIESGMGFAQMGASKEKLNYQRQVGENDVLFVPAGYWHNVTNIGRRPLKVSTAYAPPHHAHGTVHLTQEDAMAEESH